MSQVDQQKYRPETAMTRKLAAAKQSVCHVGVSAVLGDPDAGFVVVLTAPDEAQLKSAWSMIADIPLDIDGVQRTAIFPEEALF